MKKLGGLLKASHFIPTFIVSSIAFVFGVHYWWEGPAYVIAFTVFTGQLVIGWSNDLYDFADDKRHGRTNKPLVSGLISEAYLRKWLIFVVPFSLLVNVLGPLGVRGGLLYWLGVGCGVAYNFYFKFSVFSPLPYAVAFAILPSCIAVSKSITPPLWMWLGGAILGCAAHFINVIKDIDEDRESAIKGLPQRVGKSASIAIATALVLIAAAIIY
ncbi:MAG: UbiA family prenyltransferase [Actinomycetes bacterium]|jgi:4-hydroxybenzoate polyprenyltransferase